MAKRFICCKLFPCSSYWPVFIWSINQKTDKFFAFIRLPKTWVGLCWLRLPGKRCCSKSTVDEAKVESREVIAEEGFQCLPRPERWWWTRRLGPNYYRKCSHRPRHYHQRYHRQYRHQLHQYGYTNRLWQYLLKLGHETLLALSATVALLILH